MSSDTVDRVTQPEFTGAAPAPDCAPSRGAALHIAPWLLDAIVAACMGAVALTLWLGAASYDQGTSALSGPSAFPRAIALLLGVSSLLLMGRALAPRLRGTRQTGLAMQRPRAVFGAMALVVAYPGLIQALGYYGATALWLPVLLWVAGCRRPLGVAVASLGFLLFSRVVFQQLLGTPMP